MLDLLEMGVANSGARKAADAVKQGDQNGINGINGQLATTTQNFQPYMQAG